MTARDGAVSITDKRGRTLAPPPRYALGERVRIVGSCELYAFIMEINPGRVTRYRLDGHRFWYFESDLEKVQR